MKMNEKINSFVLFFIMQHTLIKLWNRTNESQHKNAWIWPFLSLLCNFHLHTNDNNKKNSLKWGKKPSSQQNVTFKSFWPFVKNHDHELSEEKGRFSLGERNATINTCNNCLEDEREGKTETEGLFLSSFVSLIMKVY